MRDVGTLYCAAGAAGGGGVKTVGQGEKMCVFPLLSYFMLDLKSLFGLVIVLSPLLFFLLLTISCLQCQSLSSNIYEWF